MSDHDRRMPFCKCGHGWAYHVIPGGVENIDIDTTERWCVDDDCRCRNYIPNVLGVHGKTCRKALHTDPQGGYLHPADDDRPYDVDGVKYCGRCHRAM